MSNSAAQPKPAVDPASSAGGGLKELTIPAILLGAVLSVVMGAANVYLGLKAGMTVAASIPAAVIAMGILHGMMLRKSLLESNLVQTGASAGESLAAGIIFTMPALVMIGVWQTFNFWTTTLIAMAGGLIGVLFMIPMRKVFVVENTELAYPEGVACAEVLRAGEGEGGAEGEKEVSTGARLLFGSLGIGAVFKFVGSFFGLFASAFEFAKFAGSRIFVFGLDISPALVGVGYIIGVSVAIQVFLGGAIGWIIGIPLMGGDPASDVSALDQAWTLWSKQVRYIGVGAMVVGGVVSIWRVRGSLVSAISEMAHQLKNSKALAEVERTQRNLSGRTILGLSVACILLTAGIYYTLLDHHISITITTTVIMVVMAFFFTAVATYIVGLVGSSNSPVSGMTICTVLVTGGILLLFGFTGTEGMVATLGVAGIVCCVCCTSGDIGNDLKTGYIVGASPRNQQIMQILGVVVASFIMAPVLIAIHEGSLNAGTGGIGGRELPAPQAGMFAAIANGFFGEGKLPWNMLGWGVGIGVLVLIADTLLKNAGSKIRLHVMPVAVGIYLPIGLTAPMLIGGMIRGMVTRAKGMNGVRSEKRGVLIASGIIAGESVLGVVLAILAYFHITSLKWGAALSPTMLEVVSVGALFAFLIWMYRTSLTKN